MEEDYIKPPPLFHTAMELRILYEFPSCFLSNFFEYPKGDGHPILVLPGFMSNDISTYPMRSFLARLGYKVHGWKLGINLGYSKEFEYELLKVLYGIFYFYNRKISLVGWSLGGVFAREIAKRNPEMVRSVITMGSPFNYTEKCTNLKWLYKIVGRQKIENISKSLLDNLSKPPPVPTTAIYSFSDGVASSNGCKNQKCYDQIENVPVNSSHIGLGFNLNVYKVLANRLAQKEGGWEPYAVQ